MPSGAAVDRASGDRARLCLISFLVGIGLALALSGSASAGLVHPFVGTFGSFANPQAVTVAQGTHEVVVLDVGAGTVLKFDSSGTPSDFSALGSNTLSGAAGGADATPEGGFAFDANSAAQLAVDSSGGTTNGFLYVTNSVLGVVDVFDSTGAFVGEIDGSAASPQTGFEPCGVAVDPVGDVYVSYNEGHVDKYTPIDSNPAHDTFAGQIENLSATCNIAVDSGGNVYVAGRFGGPLTKYDPSQFGQASPTGTDIDDTNTAVAVDQTTGDVYSDHGDHINEYDLSGNLIGKTGAGHLSGGSFGVAIDDTSGNLYASDAGAADALQFGPAVSIDPPAVTIDQPSNVTTTGATLTGTVNPSGNDPLSDTSWHFEYSTDGGGSFTSTAGGDAGTGTSPVQVSDQISGLIPNEQVQVRLVATNAADTTTSSDVFFTTTAIAPTVTTQLAQDITPTSAALPGLINPNNSPTTYYFQYGPTTAYGTSIPATQDGDAGAASVVGGVIQRIGGLQPGQTYHFRLVATNGIGTTDGQDQTFTTTTAPAASPTRPGIPGSGFLPDDRGWEKVSPGDKNGGDVTGDSQRVRVASGGNAVQFTSLSTFGDAVGNSVATDYMSTRTASGWMTHAITPRQPPLTYPLVLNGGQTFYDGIFSSDLATGFLAAESPVTAEPSVAGVPNLYLRNDLLAPGAGSYQLLSLCPACIAGGTPLPATPAQTPNGGRPYLAGASADFGHVIFESQEPLTGDTPPGCNNDLADTSQCPPHLYEWDHGTVRLAGILPDGECSGAPPCAAAVSQAGQGANLKLYTPHAISADGSRIFFTVPDGQDSSTGALYMRLNHTTTVKLNASERTNCADHDPCDGTPEPDAPTSARYWDASAGGSRVFFTTTEALTDDAPVNGDGKLYMYDTTKPGSDPHNLTFLSPDHEPADPGDVDTVLGVSGDGHYVYFLAAGQLVAGQPRSGVNGVVFDRGIYVWHDGVVRFITAVSAGDDGDDTSTSNWLFHPPVARVTPDGKHLLFSSKFLIGATGYDQTCRGAAICRQLYVYDYDSQRSACASCVPGDVHASDDAFDYAQANIGVAVTSTSTNEPLSFDGRRVFFATRDALVPQDVNGRIDVYEYDVASGTVHLISSGRDPSDSYFLNASPSGDDVLFITRARLTSADTDNSYDLYDARVGGGFREPPPGTSPCAGDTCRVAQSTPPAASAPASGGIARDGNVVSQSKPKRKPKRCRRGFVRKRLHGKVACVKARKPKHKARRAARPKRVNAVNRRPR